MNVLEFKDIKKSFGKENVLSGVTLKIKEGEIFGLIGTSGCGKSTLLKILTGMTKADSGEIFITSENLKAGKDFLKESTGFATQENMLFDELTIRENSHFFGQLYGIKKKQINIRLAELLDLLMLKGFEDVLLDNLSGGMVKRANLLVSLIHEPKLLILDEPTVGLDSILRASLWRYINKINKAGTTILVTSHLLDEIEQNCASIAILKKGRIIAAASPAKFREKYKGLEFKDIFERLIRNESI